ncbi:MAG: MerR family transcriptional regulator [Paracoccaceae bacterium]
MEKSPEAFRTISEVADFLDTPAHVLRFWESRFPQIRPVKRAGGRRYYRPGDVALLAGIKKLLHDEGMTIRGVQKILREHGIRHVAGLSEGFSGDALESPLDPLVDSILFRGDLDEEDDGPEAEGARSAQIISLEVALGRAEQASAAGENSWPQDPRDSTTDEADAAHWPADKQDIPPAPTAADLQSAGPTVAEAPDMLDDTPAQQEQAAGLTDGPDHGLPAETPTTEALSKEPATPSSTGAESIADSAITDSPQDAALVPEEMAATEGAGSDSPEDEPKADPEVVVEPTLAALLRRRSAVQLADRQADLIRLRDRLSDLRHRVAEAARRRAK